MKKLENKLIITFPNTVSAIAMEKASREHDTPGRLIPVPTQISAGCGMCWCAEPEQETICMDLIQKCALQYEEVIHL